MITSVEEEIFKADPRLKKGMIGELSVRSGGSAQLTAPECEASDCDNPFPIVQAISEISADDRRRSILIDPKESYISSMVDFFSGRIDSLEIRNINHVNFKEFEEELLEVARTKIPSVQINTLLYSREEILRDLNLMINAVLEDKNIAFTSFGVSCVPISHGMRATRGWFNNGRRYDYQTFITERCSRCDGNCCNSVYFRETNIVDRTWFDGNPNNPPPTVPPNYNPIPWSNSIKLFKNSSNYFVTSDYGWRQYPANEADFHSGIDINAPSGTEILAPESGEVVAAISNGYDSFVYVRSAQGIIHNFYHVSPTVKQGDKISAGGVVGIVATGGRDHLHYAKHRALPVSDHNSISIP